MRSGTYGTPHSLAENLWTPPTRRNEECFLEYSKFEIKFRVSACLCACVCVRVLVRVVQRGDGEGVCMYG